MGHVTHVPLITLVGAANLDAVGAQCSQYLPSPNLRMRMQVSVQLLLLLPFSVK